MKSQSQSSCQLLLCSVLLLGSALFAQDVPVPPAITPTPSYESSDDLVGSIGSLDEEGVDLKDASKLFRRFRSNLDSEPKVSDAAFERFLSMSPKMQRRLLTFLDREWLKRKRTASMFQKNVELDQLALQRKREAVGTNRKTLQDIRTMGDEGAMKAELKGEGWAALMELQVLFKGTDRRSLTDDRIMRRKQESALRIGTYRQRIRTSLGESATEDPSKALGIQPDHEKKNDATISIDAKSVLHSNEALLKKLSKSEAEGIRQLNLWRIYLGLRPLRVDLKLCDAARDHCRDMATLGFFAHESPVEGKRTPGDRARRFGTRGNGENIAINRSTAAANKSWFHSPGHHKNMFSPRYSVVGFGHHGRHFTQMFR